MKKRWIAPLATAVLAAFVFAGCADGEASQGGSVVSAGSEAPSRASAPASSASFEEYFGKNPLDAAHTEEKTSAITTTEIVELESKYADLWQKEIESAYQRLLSAASSEEQATIEKEQTKWESERQGKLDEIAQDAQQNGGTMAGILSASNAMAFYRERAKELYEKLYTYDPAYSYAYESGQAKG